MPPRTENESALDETDAETLPALVVVEPGMKVNSGVRPAKKV